MVKNLPAMWEIWVQYLGWEEPLEKGKATHSSNLARRIPWTVWSMGPQRVVGFPGGSAGKEVTGNVGDLGSIPELGRSAGEGKGHPLQYSGLENFMDYSPWGPKESDTTEKTSLSYDHSFASFCMNINFQFFWVHNQE